MPPRKRAPAKPKAKPPEEPTPIADQVEADLRSIPEEDVTHFEEDDDPLSLVGDFEDEEKV